MRHVLVSALNEIPSSRGLHTHLMYWTLSQLGLALASFSADAWKCTARDRWIGWDFRHQYNRLHSIAYNSRFLILPEHQPEPGLAYPVAVRTAT